MRYLEQLRKQRTAIWNEMNRYQQRLDWRELFANVLANAGNGSLFVFVSMLKAKGYVIPSIDLYHDTWEIWYSLDGDHYQMWVKGTYDNPQVTVLIEDLVSDRGEQWTTEFEEQEFPSITDAFEYIKQYSNKMY